MHEYARTPQLLLNAVHKKHFTPKVRFHCILTPTCQVGFVTELCVLAQLLPSLSIDIISNSNSNILPKLPLRAPHASHRSPQPHTHRRLPIRSETLKGCPLTECQLPPEEVQHMLPHRPARITEAAACTAAKVCGRVHHNVPTGQAPVGGVCGGVLLGGGRNWR